MASPYPGGGGRERLRRAERGPVHCGVAHVQGVVAEDIRGAAAGRRGVRLGDVVARVARSRCINSGVFGFQGMRQQTSRTLREFAQGTCGARGHRVAGACLYCHDAGSLWVWALYKIQCRGVGATIAEGKGVDIRGLFHLEFVLLSRRLQHLRVGRRRALATGSKSAGAGDMRTWLATNDLGCGWLGAGMASLSPRAGPLLWRAVPESW